ncbi:MAG: glycerol-3-phosphate acyltransferase PlsX [Puniceicoccaceae bacterium 5H]|nr:MAG: glycerol-3-phosphate acyltransferase PlsX [Puniceicoccaceae bacterium 5H]
MGADRGVQEMVAGAAEAIRNGDALDGVVIVGDEAQIQDALKGEGLADDQRVKIFHASQVVEMSDKPLQAIRKKKDASLVRMVELVKEGTCAAGISCGNTGALMAAGQLRLRTLDGVDRAALATVWPSESGHFLLLDAGANPMAKPEHLVHYAMMGNAYARDAIGLKQPRIGLLSIGTEEGKGTELTSRTHDLLKFLSADDDRLNYVGLIEGFQLFNGDVDVVVTDGFTGNVVLKSSEALYKMITNVLKQEVKSSSALTALGGLLIKPAIGNMKERLNPERYGGAPLLGLRGTVLKSHGSSSRDAISNAIRIASQVVERKLISHVHNDVLWANERLKAAPAAE